MGEDRVQFERNTNFLLNMDILEAMFPSADIQPRVGKRQTEVLLDAANEGGIWLPDEYNERSWRGRATPRIPGQYLSEDRQHWGDFYTIASLVRRGLLRWVLNDIEDVFAITDEVEQAALSEIGKKAIYGAKVNSWLVMTRDGWIALFKKIARDGVIEAGDTFDRRYVYRETLFKWGNDMGLSDRVMCDLYLAAQRIIG